MRIYCLTSIILREDFSETIVDPTPYPDDAEEDISLETEEELALQNLKNYGTCNLYHLTEICIGYAEKNKKKMYVMNIYREDVGLLVIPMVRGMVNYKILSKKHIELYIPLRKFYKNMINWDLEIRIRCIKNTSTKGIISNEEKILYRNFAKEVNDSIDPEAAFDTVFFQLPNQSQDNILRTKFSDLRALIGLLCHPKTGSYKNVRNGKRYNQQVRCLMMINSKWNAKAPRKGVLKYQAKNYHGCTELEWTDVDLKDVTLTDIDPNVVKNITFKQVKSLFNYQGTLHPCLKNILYQNLTILSLTCCNLTEISHEFKNLFSSPLVVLDLSHNNITFIPNEISKLKKLKALILNHNNDLVEMPWEYLPTGIFNLQLKETNILLIPGEIRRLKSLQVLNVSSKKLRYVAWEDISTTIIFLEIRKAEHEINEFILIDKGNLIECNLINAELEEFDCTKLPQSIENLNLSDNKIQSFDSQDALPALQKLIFSRNALEFICWENLSPVLEQIDFSKNEIRRLVGISYLINLKEILGSSNHIYGICDEIGKLSQLTKIDLENNHLSILPESFQQLIMLTDLNLTNNNFNYSENNLEVVLWKRLPRNLKTLRIGKNKLHSLPCCLKDINIINLHVNDTQLIHMCPFLYSNLDKNQTLLLNINENSAFTILSFIPQVIYLPPGYYDNENDFADDTNFTLYMNLPENADVLKKLVVTSRFPTKSKKPVYNFHPYKGKDTPVKCNCCAQCGEYTNNELIEQLMIMDCHIKLKCSNLLQKSISPNSNKTQDVLNIHSIKNNEMALIEVQNQEKKLKYYPPGKWKTTLVTRLCNSCIETVKAKSDKTFEEFLNNKANNEESNDLNGNGSYHHQYYRGIADNDKTCLQLNDWETISTIHEGFSMPGTNTHMLSMDYTCLTSCQSSAGLENDGLHMHYNSEHYHSENFLCGSPYVPLMDSLQYFDNEDRQCTNILSNNTDNAGEVLQNVHPESSQIFDTSNISKNVFFHTVNELPAYLPSSQYAEDYDDCILVHNQSEHKHFSYDSTNVPQMDNLQYFDKGDQQSTNIFLNNTDKACELQQNVQPEESSQTLNNVPTVWQTDDGQSSAYSCFDENLKLHAYNDSYLIHKCDQQNNDIPEYSLPHIDTLSCFKNLNSKNINFIDFDNTNDQREFSQFSCITNTMQNIDFHDNVESAEPSYYENPAACANETFHSNYNFVLAPHDLHKQYYLPPAEEAQPISQNQHTTNTEQPTQINYQIEQISLHQQNAYPVVTNESNYVFDPNYNNIFDHGIQSNEFLADILQKNKSDGVNSSKITKKMNKKSKLGLQMRKKVFSARKRVISNPLPDIKLNKHNEGGVIRNQVLNISVLGGLTVVMNETEDIVTKFGETIEGYIDEQNVYFAPDDAWLTDKCFEIGAKFYRNVSKYRQSIPHLQRFIVQKPVDIIEVVGDGHCGFKTISVLLSGTPDHHGEVRKNICGFIIGADSILVDETKHIFKDARKIANAKLLIDTSRPVTDSTYWMNDADIAAAAALFQCNIFVFNIDKIWQCYAPKTFYSGIMSASYFDPAIPTLLMDNSTKDANHFNPVINVRKSDSSV